MQLFTKYVLILDAILVLICVLVFLIFRHKPRNTRFERFRQGSRDWYGHAAAQISGANRRMQRCIGTKPAHIDTVVVFDHTDGLTASTITMNNDSRLEHIEEVQLWEFGVAQTLKARLAS